MFKIKTRSTENFRSRYSKQIWLFWWFVEKKKIVWFVPFKFWLFLSNEWMNERTNGFECEVNNGRSEEKTMLACLNIDWPNKFGHSFVLVQRMVAVAAAVPMVPLDQWPWWMCDANLKWMVHLECGHCPREQFCGQCFHSNQCPPNTPFGQCTSVRWPHYTGNR